MIPRWYLLFVACGVLAAVLLGSIVDAQATGYGASYAPTAHADEHRWAGKAKVARIFDSNQLGEWDDYPPAQRAYAGGVRKFSFSWKGTDPQDIRDFATTVPKGVRIWGTYWHEPEDDIEAQRFTLKQWKARTIEQAAVMREVGIVPTRILMGYTLFPESGRNVADYDLPAGTIAVSALDMHLGPKRTGERAARLLLREQRRTGLPLAVPEVSGPAKKARAFKALIDGRARWACWFTYSRGMGAAQAKAWFE